MLVGTKVCNNIKAPTRTEHFFKNRLCIVYRIWYIVIWNIHSFCTTKISGKFCKSVFVYIDYNKSFWFKWKTSLNKGTAYTTSTANNKQRLIFNSFRQSFRIVLNIFCKKTGVTLSDKF